MTARFEACPDSTVRGQSGYSIYDNVLDICIGLYRDPDPAYDLIVLRKKTADRLVAALNAMDREYEELG